MRSDFWLLSAGSRALRLKEAVAGAASIKERNDYDCRAMRYVTSTQLRTRTRQLLKRISRGDTVIVTFRGKPAAVLAPFEPLGDTHAAVRPFEEAWPDIEAALAGRAALDSFPEATRRRK